MFTRNLKVFLASCIAPFAALAQVESEDALGTGGCSGRIVDATTNKGVENLCISVYRLFERDGERHRACTDSDGRLALTGLSPGKYGVSLERKFQALFAPGGEFNHLSFPNIITPMDIGKDEVVDFEVMLERAVVLRGKVVDSEGKPVRARIISNSGVCAFAAADTNGFFELTGLEPNENRQLLIMSSAEYGYSRIIQLKQKDMVAGKTFRLPNIVMPALKEPNVRVRFELEGQDEWVRVARHKSSIHSNLRVRSIDGDFEGTFFAFTDVKEFLLPPGRYRIDEYEQPKYRTVNLTHTAPRVVKSPPQEFTVSEVGVAELTVTIVKPPE